MTAERNAGAASHAEVDWHAIDWQQVHQNVRRLQARIVKATQERRWGKVKALQRLLTHSFSGKALAVKRVTENQGKRTPGVDGETWNTPVKKATAVHTLRQRGYKPKPLRRVYIPKSNGKMRPLGIPTMRDRAMQALYLLALEPIAETTGDRNSYGFRTGRSTADAIVQCHMDVSRKGSAKWVLEGDIKACFDRISHDWLLANIPMEKAILRKWLKAGFMERHVFNPTEEGTPQGGIISPVLANMALDGLEHRLRDIFPHDYAHLQARIHFVRYADDFIITGRTKELLEEKVLPAVEQFMRERGLELSQEKTCITHLEDGFDFLGQNIREYAGKVLTMPSKKNVQTFLDKVRTIIQANKAISAGTLISRLNPIIRGWAQYHQFGASSRAYHDVDHLIFRALWQWAKRRHSNKPRRWVRNKYFRSVERRNWVFSGEVGDQTRRLFSAASVPIKRHVKVKGAANPFDPAWEAYFEQRLGVKMAGNLKGRKQLLHLWREQNGSCPVCHQKITELTGWHNHHIIWRTKGGTDSSENRVLLHPNCHMQVHRQGLYVEKPRPEKGVRKA
jgi:RNA-directed DNA polymerase